LSPSRRTASWREITINTLLNVNAFIRVARLGSFSAAARELHVAPSVVTKRVSQLEKELRARLINRSTRGLALTAAGERHLPRFVRLIAQHDEIFNETDPQDQRVEGRLRIQTPPAITSMFLGTILGNFQIRHPGVDLDLVMTERSVNPLEEGFDLGLSAVPVSYPNVIDVPLCRYDLVLVCAPSYLKGKEKPQHPTELIEHQCLTTVLFRTSWGFTHSRGSMNVEVHSRMQSSDSRMVRDAARMGLGITILPRFLVHEDLGAGTLVPLLEDFPVSVYWLKALVPRMKMHRPAIRELIAFMKDSMPPMPTGDR
jgi:DNA-binding transcriptional LysR family regulator